MSYVRNPGQVRMRELLTSGKRFNLVYGGSRSGKTFELVGTIVERALIAPESRHLIVRHEGSAARRAIVKGTWPEVCKARWPAMPYDWNGEFGYFQLPNKSQVWIGGLNDEKAMERILGNEYSTIYENEASEITYSAHNLLRTRLAATARTIEGEPLTQRMYTDLNPTVEQHWTYQLWFSGVDPLEQMPVEGAQYGAVVVNPEDNAANLSAEYLADLRSLPPAQRKRFYEGKFGSDDADALWRRAVIVRANETPDFARIVVAIDPAVSSNAGSDETGIVVCALDGAGNGYVLDDVSGRMKPEQWARQAIAAYDIWNADLIVGEVNQGGDMVENTIRAVRHGVPFKAVRASRGKYTRAEPLAALYERRKVFHVGEFPALESQMCSFKPDMDRKKAGYSPDRVDALVWGLTELFPGITRGHVEMPGKAAARKKFANSGWLAA